MLRAVGAGDHLQGAPAHGGEIGEQPRPRTRREPDSAGDAPRRDAPGLAHRGHNLLERGPLGCDVSRACRTARNLRNASSERLTYPAGVKRRREVRACRQSGSGFDRREQCIAGQSRASQRAHIRRMRSRRRSACSPSRPFERGEPGSIQSPSTWIVWWRQQAETSTPGTKRTPKWSAAPAPPQGRRSCRDR